MACIEPYPILVCTSEGFKTLKVRFNLYHETQISYWATAYSASLLAIDNSPKDIDIKFIADDFDMNQLNTTPSETLKIMKFAIVKYYLTK